MSPTFDFTPGQRVLVSLAQTKLPIVRMVVMAVDPIHEAAQRQPDSKRHFDLAHIIFGADTKVLWVADEHKTFIGDHSIDGFPILLTCEGSKGLDGGNLTVLPAED